MEVKNIEIFSTISLEQSEGQITASLAVNPGSEIFDGHFPGQPIVPGACMLQLVKDVLEDALQTSFHLKKADNLKFTSMIVPAINDMVRLDLSYKPVEGGLNVTAKLVAAEVVCFKFQGSFVEE